MVNTPATNPIVSQLVLNTSFKVVTLAQELLHFFSRHALKLILTVKKWRSSWARVTTFKEVLSTSWLTIGLVADDWIGGWRVYHIDYEQGRVIRAKETWQDW